MLERQLEYEKVKLEAETRRSNLEAQEKVSVSCLMIMFFRLSVLEKCTEDDWCHLLLE